MPARVDNIFHWWLYHRFAEQFTEHQLESYIMISVHQSSSYCRSAERRLEDRNGINLLLLNYLYNNYYALKGLLITVYFVTSEPFRVTCVQTELKILSRAADTNRSGTFEVAGYSTISVPSACLLNHYTKRLLADVQSRDPLLVTTVSSIFPSRWKSTKWSKMLTS